MSIAPDGFDYDYERSRAAVAVACLRWLRCTGPAIDLGVEREIPPVVDFLRDPFPIVSPAHAPEPGDSPHPLWDRWLDG